MPTPSRLMCGALFVLVLLMAAPAAPAAVDIPHLAWSERSDWINVKTDVTPGAKGDGITDDTAAIQAALTLISNLGGQTEPGTSKPRAVNHFFDQCRAAYQHHQHVLDGLRHDLFVGLRQP